MAANLSPVGAPSSGSNEHPRLDDPPRSSICRRITDFPRNLYRWFSGLRLVASPGIGPFNSIGEDMTVHILSFLENKDLRVQDSVSHYFRPLINPACRKCCQNERFLPESLPPGVNYKQFFFHKFPNAIRSDFFEEYFGKVDTVPLVPINFIKMAPRPGFKLVFIPEYITITVDANSPLMLDETTAVNGKKARLIEGPKRAPLGLSREIKVPVTPNNIVLLAQKYLKKNLPSRFSGMYNKSPDTVLDQNGDIGVGSSHWSYQQEDVIGFGRPYRSQPYGMKGQEEMARGWGLEIVPVGERILFHLSPYIKSGKIPQTVNIEQTSTVVHSEGGGVSWQSSIGWHALDHDFYLNLYCLRYDGYDCAGAATRVPESHWPRVHSH